MPEIAESSFLPASSSGSMSSNAHSLRNSTTSLDKPLSTTTSALPAPMALDLRRPSKAWHLYLPTRVMKRRLLLLIPALILLPVFLKRRSVTVIPDSNRLPIPLPIDPKPSEAPLRAVIVDTNATATRETVLNLQAKFPLLPIHVYHASFPHPDLASLPVTHLTITSRRPYQNPLTPLKTSSTLYLTSGTHLSPHALSFISAAQKAYANRPDIAAISLSATPRRKLSSASPDHEPSSWSPISVESSAVAYRLLPSEGASAILMNSATHLSVWDTFSEWLLLRRSDWYKYPSGPGVDETPLGMSKLPESNWTRASWNVWFSKFLAEYRLAVLYPTVRLSALDEKDLYTGEPTFNLGEDLSVLDGGGHEVNDVSVKGETLREIVELGRQQGGVISFTMVNKVFLETAHSWVCNVDVGGFRPKGLLWAVTDEETREVLSEVPDSHTILLDEVKGGKETGHEFGNPGYWKLMLERTALIGDILRSGIAVFAFETDAIWLEDPQPWIDELVRQDADIVGTINTRLEVSGNFFYLRPTLPTRKLWDEIVTEFGKAYKAASFEKKKADSWTYIENDQSLLTKLVLRNETWRRSYPLSFLTLDMDKFADGRWYKPEEGFYKSARAREAVVINNNFVIGVDEKTTRAKKWGHWFWDEGTETCLEDVVRKAVRTSSVRSGGTSS